MGAFEWISQLVEWFSRLFPRWVIFSTTHGGVKFVRGKKVVPLGPGVHWYWPVTTLLMEYPLARQADDLRSQTIVTADDKVIVVGGMIVYEVKDVAALLATVHDPQIAIRDITLTAIHDVLCRLAWSKIREYQREGRLDVALRRKTQQMLFTYGVKVLKVMLTDLAPTRVYKVMQSMSKDEG